LWGASQPCLEALDPCCEGCRGVIKVGPGDAHQRQLKGHPGIGGVGDTGKAMAEDIKRVACTPRAEAFGLGSNAVPVRLGHVAGHRVHRSEEHLAEPGQQVVTDAPCTQASGNRLGNTGEHPSGVTLTERVHDAVHRGGVIGHPPECLCPLEG
jgi:hypothetical protein